MTALIMTALNMIPGVSTLIQFVVGKWMDSKVAMYQTRMGVTKDVALAAIQAEVENNRTKVGWLNAVANSRFLQFIVGGFAFPWIYYGNKVIVWDNIIHKFIWGTYGYTPPITGLVGSWAEIILGGIFVTSTGMGITAAVLNRTKSSNA
jgi:hypothetical protein